MHWEIIFWSTMGWVIYSYIGYPIVLRILARSSRAVRVREVDRLPSVSIVIAAYNEEQVIRARIENCLALDYPRALLEICIGSDGSTDQTDQIVANYRNSGVRLFQYEKRRGKASVLNDTVQQTKGEILVFTDANTIFESDLVKKLVRHFGDSRVGCVCGSVGFTAAPGNKTGTEGLYWKMEGCLKEYEGRRGAVIGASGPNYAIRRKLYEACPENTITEDFVIAMNILQRGYWVLYDPEAKANEQAGVNTSREMERRTRIGAGNFQSLCMLLPMLNPGRGFPAFAFWSHKVFRWLSPQMMAVAFASNLVLAGSLFYAVVLFAQVAFYGVAFIGWQGEKHHLRLRFANTCHYFVAMNVGLFLGFCRFLLSTQPVTWERTER